MRALLLAAACAAAAAQPRTAIKLVPGTPTPSSPVTATATPTARRDPHPASAAPALLALSGRCFSATVGAYSYELCPFRNVTQRESNGAWNAFFGILGVFGSWPTVDGGARYAAAQRYDDGTDCSLVKRRHTQVTLACDAGGLYRLTDIREPLTCEYSMTLH